MVERRGLTRTREQKSKADNRYFATMRQKEALAAENTVLTKLAEKQQRAVEGAHELQTTTGQQVVRLVLLLPWFPTS